MAIKILLLAYLIGYLISAPKIFMYLVRDEEPKFLDTFTVTFLLFMTCFINLFYPIIWIGAIVNDLVLEPLTASIKSGLPNDN